jgi:hypothetical protein
MKKLLLLIVTSMALSACANPQIKHPEYEQSPCSCLELDWRTNQHVEA